MRLFGLALLVIAGISANRAAQAQQTSCKV